MKRLLLRALLIFCSFLSIDCSALNVWTKMRDFPGTARHDASSFVIGHYGFVGGGSNGSNYYSDFYKWDQSTNTWSPIASYPGAGQYSMLCYAVNGKGYVGLGASSGDVSHTDWWSYDTISNKWTAMTSFPGTARYDVTSFVIGHKIYVIGGSAGGPPYLNDCYVYDADANTWKQLKNSPVANIDLMAGFAIGKNGYICGGYDGSSVYNTFWKYDTLKDSWSSLPSFPLSAGITAKPGSFVFGSKGYICTGKSGTSVGSTIALGYVYDTITNAWSTFTNLGTTGIERCVAVTFSIGNDAYVATGIDSLGNSLNDLWQSGICPDNNIYEGISDLHKSLLKIFPNPTSGQATIVFENEKNENLNVKIVNGIGREMYSGFFSSSNLIVNLDLNSEKNGIYLVIVQGQSMSFVQRIMLMH